MPRAQLPSTPLGWLVGIATGTVGLLAGFVFLLILERLGV
jgi:hypothetical protein